MDCFVASLLAMTEKGRFPSLRATGSRECAPDDRLREAIHASPSLRAQRSNPCHYRKNGLLRRCAPRNDEGTSPSLRAQLSVIASAAKQSISPRKERRPLQKERMACFVAEPIIGPAKGGTRWLAMTECASRSAASQIPRRS